MLNQVFNTTQLLVRNQRHNFQRIAGRELVAVIGVKNAVACADYQTIHRSRFIQIKSQIQLRCAGNPRYCTQLTAGTFQLGLQPQLCNVKINLSIPAGTG